MNTETKIKLSKFIYPTENKSRNIHIFLSISNDATETPKEVNEILNECYLKLKSIFPPNYKEATANDPNEDNLYQNLSSHLKEKLYTEINKDDENLSF